MQNPDLSSLKGKTIYTTEWLPVNTPEHYDEPYDDGDYLVITFTDGYKLRLKGEYSEEYTGKSQGEYPTLLYLTLDKPKEAVPTDSIVEQVISKMRERSAKGITTYKTTLYDNSTDDFLTHLQEELLDAANYIQKLKQTK